MLSNPDIFTFKKILAITFTNKAANEMKTRILSNLRAFAEGDFNDMAQNIIKETPINSGVLQKRARAVLREIVNNYSAFAITTIDSFTYKIVRSFAFDLGLSLNFEVELNTQDILEEAVTILISKMGQNDELTKTLLLFALFKWQQDESWDVTLALNNIAQLLIDESAASKLEKLKNKKLKDYLELHKKLKKQIDTFNSDIELFAQKGQTLLQHINAPQKAYAGGGDFFRFIKKLADKDFNTLKFDGRLSKSIANNKWHSSKAIPADISAIEKDSDNLKELYFEVDNYFDKNYKTYVLAQLALKNIIPLSVLSQLNSCLTDYKTDNNIRFNAEFNSLIRKHIKNEPVPFIYEKIGEKYSHFFIDEMQDTSVFQWENLIPLIKDALSQADSSLFLVGDAKQAIYRWRGGEAQQFMGLSLKDKPFITEKEVNTLPTNYRSFSEVITFNNNFFKHISKFLSNPAYQDLYKNSSNQKVTDKKGGYVQIDFLERGLRGTDKMAAYAIKIITILENLDTSYNLGQVCILVRTKKDGAQIAENLTAQGIEVVTSESLLLFNNLKVHFIFNFLIYLVDNSNQKALADALIFLHSHLKITTDKHSFIKPFLNISQKELLLKLAPINVDFSLAHFNEKSLYESVSYLVRCFNLMDKSDAFIQFFLEEVFNFEQKKQGTLADFLSYFEAHHDKLSIVSPENKEAVNILTIHKAKGLEFPIVIFPNDVALYKEHFPKEWYNPIKPQDFNNFETLLINGGTRLEKTDSVGQDLYKHKKEALELDNINLLYVGLTRAIEQLYLLTEMPGKTATSVTYSVLFKDYLKAKSLWQESQNTYTFGLKKRTKQKEIKKEAMAETLILEPISTDWQEHNIHIVANASKYWNDAQREAAVFGTLIHEILALIKTEDDINTTLDTYFKSGEISQQDVNTYKKMLLQVVNHPQVKPYYIANNTVYNECEIVTAEKDLIRLDRLILKDNSAVIIDYKTGSANLEHHEQLKTYAQAVSSLSYTVKHKILVYLQTPLKVVFVA